MPPYPITRAEISRSALIGNYAYLRSLVRANGGPRCELMAVVKGNAYGSSAEICAPWLTEADAEWLGVTSAGEGVSVRRLCPQPHILVMRCMLREEADAIVDVRLTPTVWDLEQLEWLTKAARYRRSATAVPIHLEIDTGMTRQGADVRRLSQFLARLKEIPELRLDGVYTHFASPEMLDSEQNAEQWTEFERAAKTVFAAGFFPHWIHAGNSSSVLSGRIARSLSHLAKRHEARCMMRPGIALYGYAAQFQGTQSAPAEAARARLRPVLAWKTEIASMRDVEAGVKVGYDATFTATKPMSLALLPVGYADGLNRKLSGGESSPGGHVLARGNIAPIVGRVSMDLTVVDVTKIPAAAVGDEVVLIGQQGDHRITADNHARWAGTIPYEILCGIAARVPRIASE